MATLLLARHGETDWNAATRRQGFTGPGLNARGRQQAEELADRLSGTALTAVYSSDAGRAVQTADAVASRRGLVVSQDDRLREINFGEWEGLTRTEVDARYSGAWSKWSACKLARPPGGESDLEVAERVIEALFEIGGRHGPDEQLLIVTSGGPIRAAQAHANGVDQALARLHFRRPENCEVVEFSIDASGLIAKPTKT
jgi:broad specificity phosphatase PhoE